MDRRERSTTLGGANPGDPATVVSPSPQTNSATITHSDQFDPNTGNTTATATETPQQADLVLSKSVDNPTPNVGDTITYTITVADNGPDTATNVQVTDSCRRACLFVAAFPSQGTYNAATGLWTVGTVDTTAPRTLRIRATVINASSTVNTATITHADQFDPDTANNTATTTTNPHPGRPVGDQDRERPHAQRGRDDLLHRHVDR